MTSFSTYILKIVRSLFRPGPKIPCGWYRFRGREDYMELVQTNPSIFKERFGHTIPMPDNKNEIWEEIDYCIVPGLS